MKVKKRNGSLQEFNADKIKKAILAAMKGEENEELAGTIATKIEQELSNKAVDVIYVEDLQDIVEKKLMASSLKDVARKYIRYRYDRENLRNSKEELMSKIGKKLMATNVVNQNANVDERSFGGRVGEAARVVTKEYALTKCMSKMSRENHENNEIYIHDLDAFCVGNHNCLTLPLDDLLKNGFNTRQADIRPAGSLNTAFQLVAVLFQIQSLQQFGGVSASHIDWSMVPYVRKSFRKHYIEGLKYIENTAETVPQDLSIIDDFYKLHRKAYKYALDMTEKECHQAVEGMFHNLNTLQSRSGNQLPFSSINFGTCTLPEGRMVIKAILEVSIEGLGKLHRTSIFPCGIFQCMKGVNRKEGDPNYDLFKLALESTAKRLYPNYCNVDWSVNAGYDRNDPRTYVSTMGKRKL